MSSIKWGVYLREPSWDVKKLEEFVENTEKIGYHGIYTNDHITGFDKTVNGKEPYLEAWTFITSVLMWSKQLHAGHTVICNSFRNPALLGKMVSSLDNLSKGRFDLFLGAGWKEDEYLAYSYPFPSPGTRLRQLEEAVTILRKLFDPKIEEWDFEGEFWTLKNNRNFPKPITQPFQIHLGGSKQKFIQMTARIADGFNTGGGSFDEAFSRFCIYDEEVHRLGKDPARLIKSFFGGLRIFRDEEEALKYAKNVIQKNESYSEKRPEDLTRSMPWGTPEVIANKLRKLITANIQLLIFKYQCSFSDDPIAVFWDNVRPLI